MSERTREEIRSDLESQWETWINSAYDRLPPWYWDKKARKKQQDVWVNARMPEDV